MNLISMAADIIKTDRKLSSIINSDSEDEEIEEKSTNNLVNIAGDILTEKKPTNLISVASDILDKTDRTSSLVEIASDIRDKETPSNLIKIAASVLDAVSKTVSSLDESSDDASDLEVKPTSNLTNIAGDILEKEQPKNLINIASEILEPEEQKSNLLKITSELLEEDKKLKKEAPKESRVEERKLVDDNEKLHIISELTNTLNELRIDPQFPISWLLLYMNALHNLNADSTIKSTFHRWTWSAIHDLKSNSKELSAVPPSVMVQLAQDISSKDRNNSTKLVELVDRYIVDLDDENKLNPDTFLKLVSSIPKEKRTSFDTLVKIVLSLLEKEKQKELLDLIDFQKLNEKTLEECKKSEFIPQKHITEAALSLCNKLRKELDEAKLLIKSMESTKTVRPTAKLNSDVPSYTTIYSSTKYSSPTSSSIRNRSNEPKLTEHRPTSTATVTTSSLLNNSQISNTNKINYPTLTTSLSSLSSGANSPNYHYTSNYTLTTPRSYGTGATVGVTSTTSSATNSSSTTTRSKPLTTSTTTSTYKSNLSPYMPSTSSNLSSYHHHHHHHYLDYDYDYDHADYLDDNDGPDSYYAPSYGLSKIY